MRAAVVALVAILTAPEIVHAQWSVTAQIGVHADRLRPPQRVLSEDGSSSFLMSAPGEAPAVGLRLSRTLNKHFSVDAGFAVSQNRSWSGGGTVPLPEFTKRTTFTSAAMIWRPFDPTSRLQLNIGTGPALIFHGGSGESVLTRQVDVGALVTAGASLRLGDRMRLGFDAQNYQFASRFRDVDFRGRGFPENYQPGTRWRSEWVVMPSLRIAF